MATTYTLISSNVLTGSAASVTFSSIPSTYTDLVLRVSARTDIASAAVMQIAINGSTANLSYTRLTGDGTTAASFRGTTIGAVGSMDSTADTASTFGSAEIYIPSYLAIQNKPFSSFAARENNATAAFIGAWADLWSNTAAITSLTLSDYNTGNWVSGSSFYLYGIKNS